VPLSTLCQRCGLCCDGSLFTHVPLQAGEVAAARRNALDVVERADGSPALRQRCAALEGARCTAYAERPDACRRYHCLLFSALSEGEVSLPEALGVVDQAHALIAKVDEALGVPSGDAPRAVLQRARRENLPEHGGPLGAEAREAHERAEQFLDRHFRGRQARPASAS
jgi:hypothetical protein